MELEKISSLRRLLTTSAVALAALLALCIPAGASTWDPSGVQMPVGDVPGWHQIFADNFANDSVPVGSFSGCSNQIGLSNDTCTGLAPYPAVQSKWWAFADGWSDHQYGNYWPSKVLSVANGVMSYYIHTATVNGVSYHMVSAPVPKVPGGTGAIGGQLYGRFTVRAKLDSLPAYHVAFLLWPDQGGQANGEIDWPDGPFDRATRIDGYVHYGSPDLTDHFAISGQNVQGWHTYRTDWTPTSVKLYLDGNLVGTESKSAAVPSVPMHWVLQVDTAALSEPEPPLNGTAGYVQIDWAVAYAATT